MGGFTLFKLLQVTLVIVAALLFFLGPFVLLFAFFDLVSDTERLLKERRDFLEERRRHLKEMREIAFGDLERAMRRRYVEPFDERDCIDVDFEVVHPTNKDTKKLLEETNGGRKGTDIRRD